jgi:imidazoleglycerol-phosphate dehydratase
MNRTAKVNRQTKETEISLSLGLDTGARADIQTGIGFFDHMLTLFAMHGFFDLSLHAKGDIEVDCHHTVEDVGLVMGEGFDQALGDRKGITRFGHAVTPMDDALASVAIDLSRRPFLIYHVPSCEPCGIQFNVSLAKEFFRAFANRSGMNLHVNVSYGENEHHILEAVFKSMGRALNEAVATDRRIADVRSTKGVL